MGGNVFKETNILDENGNAFTDSNRLPVDAEISGPVTTEVGIERLLTADKDVKSLLSEILRQIKIMNFHLKLITEEEIINSDIEGI